MKAHIEHVIDIAADQFFDKVYFNEDYNRGLYEELRFRERDLVEDREDASTRSRVVRQVPERDIPGAIRKVIGVDRLEFTERTTYYKGKNSADIHVASSVMPEKIKIVGKFWVEPLGPSQCKRCFDVDVNVGIFMVGGTIEKMIVDDVKESYDKAAAYTNRFVKQI